MYILGSIYIYKSSREHYGSTPNGGKKSVARRPSVSSCGSLAFSPAPSYSPSHTPTPTPTPTLSRSLALALSRARALCVCVSVSLSLCLSLTRSLALYRYSTPSHTPALVPLAYTLAPFSSLTCENFQPCFLQSSS